MIEYPKKIIIETTPKHANRQPIYKDYYEREIFGKSIVEETIEIFNLNKTLSNILDKSTIVDK